MPDITPHTECLSDLVIDEALSGELPIQARSEIERHLAECTRCRNRWDDIEKERAQFLSNTPSFETLAAKVAHAAKPRKKTWNTPWLAGLGAAAAAAVVFMLVRQPSQPIALEETKPAAQSNKQQTITTRSKGGPHIGFFIKRGNTINQGRSGAIVHPGDRLRFTYSSDTPRYLALFNLDAKRASVYFPSGPHAERVAAGRDIALDFSVELDEYIGSERVFAVFCDTPFPIEPVRRALANNREMTKRSDCTVDTIQLTKEPAP